MEGHTSRSEVQGDVDGANTGDEDSTRNCVGVDNGESLPDNERGIALRSSLATEIKQQEFHLVKLARNGMVYISIPSRSPGDLVKFFAKIINDFHTRSRAAPRYFHRFYSNVCFGSHIQSRNALGLLIKRSIATRGQWLFSDTPSSSERPV